MGLFIISIKRHVIGVFAYSLLSFLHYGSGRLPYPTCFDRLNKSDCSVPKTIVFTYYHPGSRCEMEEWRGCPSGNLFVDEVQCSDACIFSLPRPVVDNELPEPTEPEPMDPCITPLDLSDCGLPPTKSYTYNATESQCVIVPWRGCDGPNRYNTETQCATNCKVNPLPKEVKDLDKEELAAVNDILNEVINEIPTPPPTTTTTEEITTEEETTAIARTEEVTTTELITEAAHRKEEEEEDEESEEEHQEEEEGEPGDAIGVVSIGR